MSDSPGRIETLLVEREWVRALARSLVADASTADDVEQDTWTAAVRRPPHDVSSPRAWLGTVVRNFARRTHRGASRRHLREVAAARPEALPPEADRLARAEAHRRVVAAVLGLEEPYRSAVLARYFDDVPAAEIARQAGVPPETVRTRLKRALAMLRARLDAEYGGDGRAWGAAVLPLAALRGGLAVKSTTKAGIAVAALLLIAGVATVGAWRFGADGDAPEPAETAASTAPSAPPRAVPRPAPEETSLPAPAVPAGTSCVRGEVWLVSPESPAAGVTVSVGRGAAARTVTTDDAGRFRVEGLPTGFRGTVRARREGTCTSMRPLMPLREGEERDVGVLRLSVPAAADVIVLEFDGKPIAGAQVSAWRTPQMLVSDPVSAAQESRDAAEPAARLVTDAEGRARFSELEPDTWTFTARASGYVSAASSETALRAGRVGGPVRLHLERGHVLTGRVVDGERRPLAGIRVVADEAPTQGWGTIDGALPQATTGADGRFSIDGLRVGAHELRVGRDASPLVGAAKVRVPRADAVELVLAGRRITGTVRDAATGAGVPGAIVRGDTSGGTNYVETMTDASGRYVLDTLVRTEWVSMLAASKPGFVNVTDPAKTKNPQNAPIWWLPSKGDFTVDLVLRRAALVSGRVTADGAPVRDALVVANRRRESPSNTRTDSDGRYAFDRLDRGRVWIQVTAEGFGPSAGGPDDFTTFWNGGSPPGTVEVPETGAVTHDVVMIRGVEVAGRVVDPDGTPASGAYVRGWPVRVPCDEDGSFTVRVAPQGGKVGVYAEVPEVGYGQFSADAASGPLTGVTIRLTAYPRLRGSVVGAGGPVVGAWAETTSVPAHPGSQPDWTAAQRRPVGADGSFDRGVYASADGVLVRAGAPGHATATTRVAPAPDGSLTARIVLSPAARLAGRVTVRGTGAPCPGAEVLVEPENRSTPDFRRHAPQSGDVAAVTDADGRFAVEDLAAGPVFIRVQARGFVASESSVDVPSAGETTFELDPGGTISGRVRFSDGTPCRLANASATVSVEDARYAGGQRSQWFGYGATDDEGNFEIPCLPEGAYDVGVSPRTDEEKFARVVKEAVATGTRGLEITVERERPKTGRIRGRVVGPDGTTVPGARVTALPADGKGSGSATTDGDGAFTVDGLDNVEHSLHVSPPPGTPFLDAGVSTGARWLRGELRGVTPPQEDVVVTLPEGAVISGVVVDAAGAPLRGRWIAIGVPDRNRRNAFDAIPGDDTDAEGRFEITGLAPGRNVRLVDVGWPGGKDPSPLVGGEDVAPGTRGLRLTLGTFAKLRGIVVDETGAAVAGAAVQATDGKGRQRSAKSDAEGRFEIGALDAGGAVDVVAWAENFAPSNRKGVAPGAEEVRFALAPGLRATGRLLDASGKPLATKMITLRSDAHPVEQRFATDAEGRFSATGLAPGRHRATFTAQRGTEFREVPCGTLDAGTADAVLREE